MKGDKVVEVPKIVPYFLLFIETWTAYWYASAYFLV